MSYLKLPTQIVLLFCAFLLIGNIVKAIYHFIISTPWLAGSLIFLLIVGFLALLHFLSKRVWD
jgi:hypothetical protein